MNKMRKWLVVFFVLASVTFAGQCPAKQVITEDIRIWAKETAASEKALHTIAAKNTVSVLYFENISGKEKLNPLQKGIAVMLLTDLAKVKQLTVLERVRLEALMQELKLGMSGLVDEKTAPRLGKMLGAQYLVGGKISLADALNQFSFDSLMLNVPTESIDARPEVSGELLTKIFKMEKDLLFQIIAHFNIKLSEKEIEELRKVPTDSILALMHLFQGVSFSDQEDYLEAARLYLKALREDPEFELARIFLQELKDEGLWAGDFDDDPEGYSEPNTAGYSPRDVEHSGDDREDPRDREIDFDNDGFMVSMGDCNDQDPAVNPGGSDMNCNGVDDDCDGLIDEDYVEVETSCGVGVCRDRGRRICRNGSVMDTCIPATPTSLDDAVCDGIDEDCDGQIDEDYLISQTSCGVGACGATGEMVCQNGVEVDTCTAAVPAALDDTVCDGIDEDCDGQVDEDYLISQTSCGVGACEATGEMVCQNGAEVDTCAAGTPTALDDSVCDGIDEDCDGQADEDFFATLVSCGVGACQNVGQQLCENGTLIDECVPGIGSTSDETCNGIDDDCDGFIDEDCGEYFPPLVAESSLAMANENIFADSSLRTSVNNGDFVAGQMIEDTTNPWEFSWNGPYSPGLQSIGPDQNEDGLPEIYTGGVSLDYINDNNFLAYAVQVEEDRLNRRILEMFQGDVNDLLTAGTIRTRDDFLMQQADAQAGRVLRDREGYLARVQQYVLRPDPQTVQVLNVTLRGEGSPQAGLSTIDFTTRFTGDIDVNPRSLPWDLWFDTSQMQSQLFPDRFVYTSENPLGSLGELDTMNIRITGPSGNFLEESRSFGASEFVVITAAVGYWIQEIQNDLLVLDVGGLENTYTYDNDGTTLPGEYRTDPLNSTFQYVTFSPSGEAEPLVTADMYVIGDSSDITNTNEPYEGAQISDIWEALGINEYIEGPSVGANNLEMVFSHVASNPNNPPVIADVVYIPMSRMIWKD